MLQRDAFVSWQSGDRTRHRLYNCQFNALFTVVEMHQHSQLLIHDRSWRGLHAAKGMSITRKISIHIELRAAASGPRT